MKSPICSVLLTICSCCSVSRAGSPPKPPVLSTFAPAVDLVGQVKVFIAAFDAALASEQDYNDKKDQVRYNANALAAVAVALGLHDAPNELQTAAPALVAAAQILGKAKTYAEAQTGLKAVHAALDGKAKAGNELSLSTKVAGLGQLMKQAASTDARLRRNLKRFDRLAADNARDSALLAVIAQASMADTHEVKNPADLPKWYQWCVDMRDAAASVNRAIKAKDPAAADAAAKRLMQSCDDCHAVFQTK